MYIDKKAVNQYSPLTLAFLGDAVYEQFVRERLVKAGNMSAGKLHKEAVRRVRAAYQARACVLMAPILTEDETAVAKRGRNACGNFVPKSSNPVEYGMATSLETLFGYLFLTEDKERLEELFEFIWLHTPA
jgi:ribonuclease-3 family protein